ncbi:hypothetical protein MMAN_05140 [Mycobacterium mantenii]|uniref:Transcriptional regulator n=1 Tax=Mycobacterium mantenii TaxID=560555 RepID=A0ABM7JLK6_MYCNT|nr:hypothetical protein MMAN_05140 [Mycobacterium mantenii]
MATAIARSADTGEPVAEVLNGVAREYGRTMGATAAVGSSAPAPPQDAAAAVKRAVRVLSRYGYEPRFRDGEVKLANCPFHALAQEQTELACTMNHALITGVADALGPHRPDARLCPNRGRCCVVLTPGPNSPPYELHPDSNPSAPVHISSMTSATEASPRIIPTP